MTETEKLYKVFEKIGREAVLEQLIEECGELVQAAAKQLCIFRGVNYTPVKLSENSSNLLEESADLELCQKLLKISFSANTERTEKRTEKIKAAKLARWLERLEIEEK